MLKNTKINKFSIILFILVLGVFYKSNADHRNFVWTYEYMTMDHNKAELESYQTYKINDLSDVENTTSNELNLEFEIGMNEFWDVAVYQNFRQSPSSNLKYDGFKVRQRFKIGEKNKYFLDPLIYIEYACSNNFSEHSIEPKLILAKTIDNFTFSLNPYIEFEYEGKEWEYVPKYALGASYGINRKFNLGFEMIGDKTGNYIGPSISHGSSQFWFALGCLFSYGKLEEGKPELQTRMIMGFEL